MGLGIRCGLAVALACAGVVPAVPLAQADGLPAPRTVHVRMSARHIQGPHSLAAGRYRLQVRAPGHGFGQLLLVKPLPGYTVAQFKDDSVGAEGFPRARRNTRLFGGINLHPGRTGAMWETLFTGRYWLCGFTPQHQRIPVVTTLHVHGAPTVSRFPRTVAEVASLPRLGLHLDRRSIPSTGQILVRNIATNPHSIDFMPLKPGFTYRDYLRYSRNTRGSLPGSIGATTRTGLASQNVGFVMRYHLRPGRYVVFVDEGFLAGPPNLRRFSSPLTVRDSSAGRLLDVPGRPTPKAAVKAFVAARGDLGIKLDLDSPYSVEVRGDRATVTYIPALTPGMHTEYRFVVSRNSNEEWVVQGVKDCTVGFRTQCKEMRLR